MSTPLRILYVLPYTPSLIRVRPYQIIRSLANAGHRVTVVALDDGFIDAPRLEELRGICEAVHTVSHPKWRAAINCVVALPTAVPLWGAYGRSREMQALLERLLRENCFDIAHVEHLRAAHFAPTLTGLPKVLDAVDCITALRRQILDQAAHGPGKLLSKMEWEKLRRYEPAIYRPFQHIAVTSQHDAASLATLDPTGLPPIEVIPNGVDLDYFCPATGVRPDEKTIVFSGKMSYIANEDAAQFLLTDVVPHLRKKHPELQVILAGNAPSASLKEVARQTGGVTVTGYVNDLRPYLSRALFAVCPMRIGVGIQNKALEAMAMGRPVVATPLAGRALSGATGSGALRLANTAETFTNACAELLAHPTEAIHAGFAARRYAEENHRWDVAADRFVDLYQRARAEWRH